jgi:hypothetical protein
VPSTVNRSTALEDRIERAVGRRAWPIAASVLFVTAGLLYFFRWAPVVHHQRSIWMMPSDIWTTYAASSAAVHGHFGSIYGSGFLAYPGFLAVLAPLGALSNAFSTLYVQVTSHGHPFTGLNYYTSHGTPTILYDGLTSHGDVYAVHQGVFVLLGPAILLLSCTALFAFDALAEELGVERWRRAVLAGTEAVLMWGLVVVGGHPEDALSVAMASVALLWAFRGRWTGAGWWFGVAVAVQPLVIVVLPVLLVLGGRSRALGLLVRGAVPAALVVAGPLVADVHGTTHALVQQPTFPNVTGNYRTLWTPLAPDLGGRGEGLTVGGGPTRVVALVLAGAIGWWSLRWRTRPEMVLWAAALALALRVYTESVMTAYYSWPALALGVVVATRAGRLRFAAAAATAVATTVAGLWHVGWHVWWPLQVAGVTAVLLLAMHPGPAPEPEPTPKRRGPGTQTATGNRSRSSSGRKNPARGSGRR